MRSSISCLTPFVLLLACSGARAATSPTQDRLPLPPAVRGAEPASRTVMTPEETLWYDRLLAGLDASSRLPENDMSSGDSYLVGRGGGDYVEALLMAFRATGERRFLDRVLELSELARGSLRDAWLDGTTDGYTSWLWLADSTNATFYGKDTNWLDESISSGNAALWAWAFHVHRGLDPRYAAAADFWRDWLEHQFLARWYARVGGNPIVAWNTPFAAFYKPDVEPRSANWRLAHYLYAITGNPFYRDRENEIVNELIGANSLNPAHPTAYRWPRQTDPASQDWQPINYCNYYMRAVLEMNLEGLPFFSSPLEMKRFASTFRDVVYAASLPGLSTMKANNNGDGSTSYALYAFNGFSAWDSTGFLMDLADRSIVGAGNYAGGGLSKAARNDMFISAYALLALSPLGTTPTLVSRFTGTPLDDGSVRIEWQLSSETGNPLTNVYRASTDGLERARVNDAPLAGPGPHTLVDRSPGGAPTLDYELVEVTGSGERSLAQIVVAQGQRSGIRLALDQNAPNPFASSTLIPFDMPRGDHLLLAVHDGAGRLVRTIENANLPAGRHARSWDGRDHLGRPAPSGIYFLVAQTPGERVVRRAIRVR